MVLERPHRRKTLLDGDADDDIARKDDQYAAGREDAQEADL